MFDLFLIMWLADIADSIPGALFLSGALTLIVFSSLFICACEEDDKPKATRRLRQGVSIILTLIFVNVLVPSKKTLHLYAAGMVGQEIATTPLAQKAYQATDAILDKIISEAQPKKEK
jgi:hypothetical protein